MRLVVGASKPNKFKLGAAAIMWWEETPASHCYVKIGVFHESTVVFQAVGSGTEFCSLDYFLDHNIPVLEKEIEITQEQLEKIMEGAIKCLKRKYSIKHLVGLFYKRFVQYVFKKIIKNPFKDQGKSEICVEALCMIIDCTDIVRKTEDPEDMGMFEAMEMLRAIPGRQK